MTDSAVAKYNIKTNFHESKKNIVMSDSPATSPQPIEDVVPVWGWVLIILGASIVVLFFSFWAYRYWYRKKYKTNEVSYFAY